MVGRDLLLTLAVLMMAKESELFAPALFPIRIPASRISSACRESLPRMDAREEYRCACSFKHAYEASFSSVLPFPVAMTRRGLISEAAASAGAFLAVLRQPDSAVAVTGKEDVSSFSRETACILAERRGFQRAGRRIEIVQARLSKTEYSKKFVSFNHLACFRLL